MSLTKDKIIQGAQLMSDFLLGLSRERWSRYIHTNNFLRISRGIQTDLPVKSGVGLFDELPECLGLRDEFINLLRLVPSTNYLGKDWFVLFVVTNVLLTYLPTVDGSIYYPNFITDDTIDNNKHSIGTANFGFPSSDYLRFQSVAQPTDLYTVWDQGYSSQHEQPEFLFQYYKYLGDASNTSSSRGTMTRRTILMDLKASNVIKRNRIYYKLPDSIYQTKFDHTNVKSSSLKDLEFTKDPNDPIDLFILIEGQDTARIRLEVSGQPFYYSIHFNQSNGRVVVGSTNIFNNYSYRYRFNSSYGHDAETKKATEDHLFLSLFNACVPIGKVSLLLMQIDNKLIVRFLWNSNVPAKLPIQINSFGSSQFYYDSSMINASIGDGGSADATSNTTIDSLKVINRDDVKKLINMVQESINKFEAKGNKLQSEIDNLSSTTGSDWINKVVR